MQFTFLNISLYSLTELNYSIKEMFRDLNQDLQTLIDVYLNNFSKTQNLAVNMVIDFAFKTVV